MISLSIMFHSVTKLQSDISRKMKTTHCSVMILRPLNVSKHFNSLLSSNTFKCDLFLVMWLVGLTLFNKNLNVLIFTKRDCRELWNEYKSMKNTFKNNLWLFFRTMKIVMGKLTNKKSHILLVLSIRYPLYILWLI